MDAVGQGIPDDLAVEFGSPSAGGDYVPALPPIADIMPALPTVTDLMRALFLFRSNHNAQNDDIMTVNVRNVICVFTCEMGFHQLR